MCENEHQQLATGFRDLLDSLAGQNQAARERAVSSWYRSVPPALQRFAYDLVAIYKAQDRIVINTGAIILGGVDMSDKSTKVDTRGGDITGSAIGAGARVIAQIIQSIKGNIGSSGNIDAEGQKLISSAAEAIGATASLDDDEKNQALDDLQKLVAEAAKATPKTSLLKRAWQGIHTIAGTLPTVAELGKWVAVRFPDLFGS